MTLFPFLAFVGMASVMDDWLDVLLYLCLEHFLSRLPESVTYRVIWDAEHDYEDVYESPVPRWLSDIIAACREKEEKGCQNPPTT